LAVERCALPLHAKLAASGGCELPVAIKALLDRCAQTELQHVLSARAQLAHVDRVASDGGSEVIALKGAVTVLGDPRHALDLADLDLWARPADARALTAALDREGYQGTGPSSPHHLETRVTTAALPIDVHTGIEMLDSESPEALWSRSILLADRGLLRRLAPKDHLWHLLLHVGVGHPERRGAIRDLLLLAQAAKECSADELAEVEAVIDRHRRAGDLRNMLGVARDLGVGLEPVRDRFEYQSAVLYAVSWHGRRLPLPWILKAAVGRWAVALHTGRADLKTELAKVAMKTIGPSLSRPIARVERIMPRTGRLLRVVSRLVRIPVAVMFAVPLALLAAFQARRAMRVSG
jgi:hypothetical protein